MLQMYGEKAEEAEELKLDILDVKAMYRQQVRVHVLSNTITCMTVKHNTLMTIT